MIAGTIHEQQDELPGVLLVLGSLYQSPMFSVC
jgi:hypothetical protein